MPDLRPCVKCGEHIVVGDRFCPRCGAEQPASATNVIGGPPGSRWDDIERRLQKATKGRYEIRGLIGRGGMAAVYLADWPDMDLRIAIKVMDPYLLDQEHAVLRFLQEARTIAKLKHRNIIRVYDSGRAGDLYFFCMDYYPGRSLERVLKSEGQIPVPVARVWLWQAADALGYAHRQPKPVVHRDVKPSNMLLDAEGDLVLTDFGIAKVRDLESSSHSASLTMPGAVLGTPAYLSPEQAAALLDPEMATRGVPVTGASDQYSLGVVGYEMLAGEPPFRGELGALLNAHARQDPPALLEKRPDCPTELAQAVMRMLAKRPEDRWPGMQELGAALVASTPPHGSPVRVQMVALTRGERSVGAISLSPLPGALFEGQDFQIQATPLDLGGRPLPGRRLAWASSDPGVATVTPDGVVKALRAGAVCITATAEGFSQEIRLAVAPIPVDAVVVLPSQVTLGTGETAELRALVLSQDGRELEERDLAWRSSDPGVAAVDGAGRVSALRTGSATVTASSEGRSGSATVTAIHLAAASVEVLPDALHVLVGEARSLMAVVRGPLGQTLAGRAVTWSSSDAGIASVSPEGVVHPLEPGSVTVTATCEGVATRVGVTVVPVPVEAVEVEGGAFTLEEGASRNLVPLVRGKGGVVLADRKLIWSSSRPEVASVGPEGRISGLREGSASVRVECEGIQRVVEVRVVPEAVSSLHVSPATLRLRAEESAGLEATPVGKSGRPLARRWVRWSSDDPGVATVTPEGWVVGVAPGETRVQASCDPIVSSVPVVVFPAAMASLEVSPRELLLAVGETSLLKALARSGKGAPLEGRDLVWSFSDPSVAEITPEGRVTARGTGSGTIRVTGEGHSAEVAVRVTPEAVASVELHCPTSSMVEGESVRIHCDVFGASGRTLPDRPVSWSCDTPELASVDAEGTVHALGPGHVTVSARCEGREASVGLQVEAVPVASLEITPSAPSLLEGEELQLQCALRDREGRELRQRPVSWTSSDPAVARVDREGLVQGVSPGTVTVVATCQQSSTVSVEVRPLPVARLELEVRRTALRVGETLKLGALPRSAGGRALQGRTVDWESSDPAVASVDASGLVTGVAPGVVRIGASCQGVTASATLGVREPSRAVRPWMAAAGGVAMVVAILAVWRPWGRGEGGSGAVPPAGPVVAALAILPGDSLSLVPGQSLGLALAGRDEAGVVLADDALPPPRWETTDSAVATVSESGVLLAVAPGLARVVASVPSAFGGEPRVFASAALVVTATPGAGEARGQEGVPTEAEPTPAGRAAQVPEAERRTPPPTQPQAVTSLRLNPSQGNLTEGETLQLRLTDQNGSPVSGTLRSSDPAVATVSPSGVLSAVGAGEVRVTATFQDLTVSGRFRVEPLVVDPPPSVLDSLREGLAQVREHASLAEYDPAYRLLDALGLRLRGLERDYQGSPVLPQARTEYLQTFSSTYDGCRRFRQVMEQRGVADLPTCRPPPTGGGNDAPVAFPEGSPLHRPGSPGPAPPRL